jgi:C1A family cysteine protease
VANNYQALKYFCHDPQGANVPYPEVLESVKKYLEAGIPSMFGFWGFPSFDKSDTKGGIPYPGEGESAEWGHAIVAVGYDDEKKIKNTNNNKETTGALLIRNSWGKEWGDKGYGWMPYDYVLNNLAMDFWSLLGMDWIDSKQFGI